MPAPTVIVMSLAVLVPMRMFVVPVVVLVGGRIVMRLARPVFVLVCVFNAPMAMRMGVPDGSSHPLRIGRPPIVPDMEIAWRAPFRSSEVNALHAACFETRLYSDDEWDWNRLCERHSLGWASARTDDVLVGFANVLWDGFTHAWLQDVMVSPAVRRAGVGTRLVQLARDQADAAGCEWLHVDFEEHLRPFYLGACGFTAAEAGLIRLGVAPD